MTYDVGGIASDRPYRVKRIGHFGYHSPDLAGTMEFLTKELGLIVSDVDDFTKRVPSLPKEHALGYFMRCSTDHHTVVLGSQKLVDTREPHRAGSVVGQVSWQVGSLQEVVDGVGFLNDNATIRRIGRDAPGSNWHAYAYDPDGYINEIFYGMEQVGWDGLSKPESMYDRAFHDLPPLPQIPEYQEVNDLLGRGEAIHGYRPDEPNDPAFRVDGIMMPQPFKLTRLGRIMLFAADMDASLDFYQRIIGLKLTERRSTEHGDCAYLRADDEHHTLALYPKALMDRLGFAAAIGFSLSNYRQLRDCRKYLEERGVRILDVDPELSPGISYGFWVQGPDRVGVHLYYGMDRVERDGSAPSPTTFPLPSGEWPETIAHGGSAWYEPPFYGPLA